ncbi:hypothetical protein ARMGADRAFT_1089747 [Armillaria gallica]|uniref:Uncharacterized protein n=1 Tax=Armillaria gallica TaxID=47427 RepID=A0A2H3D3U6_ARMGA|nr:hypothetical protein ARMGADRAFT_1089747 [Armillaria gallica]
MTAGILWLEPAPDWRFWKRNEGNREWLRDWLRKKKEPVHARPCPRRAEQAGCKDDSPEEQAQTMQLAPPSIGRHPRRQSHPCCLIHISQHLCYLAFTQDMAVWLGTSCLSWRLETRIGDWIEERGSAPTASLTPRVPRRLSRPHPASTAKSPLASVVHDLAGHPSPTLPRFHVAVRSAVSETEDNSGGGRRPARGGREGCRRPREEGMTGLGDALRGGGREGHVLILAQRGGGTGFSKTVILGRGSSRRQLRKGQIAEVDFVTWMDVGQSTEVFCGRRMRREAVKRNVNARVNKFCEDGTCIAFGSTPAVSVPTLQSTPTRVTSRSPQVSTSAISEPPSPYVRVVLYEP